MTTTSLPGSLDPSVAVVTSPISVYQGRFPGDEPKKESRAERAFSFEVGSTVPVSTPRTLIVRVKPLTGVNVLFVHAPPVATGSVVTGLDEGGWRDGIRVVGADQHDVSVAVGDGDRRRADARIPAVGAGDVDLGAVVGRELLVVDDLAADALAARVAEGRRAVGAAAVGCCRAVDAAGYRSRRW